MVCLTLSPDFWYKNHVVSVVHIIVLLLHVIMVFHGSYNEGHFFPKRFNAHIFRIISMGIAGFFWIFLKAEMLYEKCVSYLDMT